MPDKIPCEIVTWHHFYQLCRVLAKRIIQSGFRPEVIVAIGRGGYMPARILSDLLGLMDLTSFKIEHYRGPGKPSRAAIRYPLSADLSGKRVLLVDDVTDSGETFLLAIEHLEQSGPPDEIRTAVLDHKTVSTYQPDYFARRIVKWRWLTYPWAIEEDIRGLLDRMVPRPGSVEAIMERLYRDHGLRLRRKQVEAILALIDGQSAQSATAVVSKQNNKDSHE